MEIRVAIFEDNKLIALIYPDSDMLKRDNITDDQFLQKLDDIRKHVNEKVPEFMSVSKYRLHPEEFVKTPKRSIKRFLYTKE